jgi:hypothetical protein
MVRAIKIYLVVPVFGAGTATLLAHAATLLANGNLMAVL